MKKNHLDNIKEINDITNKKETDYKRILLEQYNYLINEINENQLLRNYLSKNKRFSYTKEINHALTLLSAAQNSIKKDYSQSHTHYLASAAVVRLVKYLPQAIITDIVKNIYNQQAKNIPNGSPSIAPPYKKVELAKKLLHFLEPVKRKVIQPRQYVIDFAADKKEFTEYGIQRAKRLKANLIQSRPDKFDAKKASFSISEGTTLIFIGHCIRGSDCLSDNNGNRIYASQLAQQIYEKMREENTPLNTEFNIDLIACQAARDHGQHPSFAKRLINELEKFGVYHAKITASPTIMLTTGDGSEANLSFEDDKAFIKKMKNRQQHEVNNGAFSSVNTIFSNSKPQLNVKKITFKSKKN